MPIMEYKQLIDRHIKPWLDAGLSFLYPEVCQFCGKERATPAEGYIGAQCWKNVRFISPPICGRCGLPFEGDLGTPFECANCRDGEFVFRYARSAVAARGMALEIIHRYKYSNALWFEPFLADLLVRAAAPVLRAESWDMIVPVPLHRSKRAQRGFNQAERLARQLGRETGLALHSRCVARVTPTRSQTTLTRAERAANVRRAFTVKDQAALSGRRVVLVDDVFTTGATTNACAKVLRDGGAADVCVWTLARGLWH